MKFEDKLRLLRTRAGLTQEDAAKESGVSLRTYKAYELGERRPRKQEVFISLSDLFKVDLNKLIDDSKSLDGQASIKDDDPKQVLDQMLGLFAGGKLSLEDKKVVLDTLEEAYYIAKMKEEK